MTTKTIAKNSVFNIIYKGFTALFPLITTTYIARVLLPDGVGRVAYANAVVSYFVTIAALGLPNYGVKKIAQCDDSKSERSKVFLELFLINLLSTSICVIGYFIFVNTFSHFSDRRALFNVMGTLLVLNLFNIDWFYQGIEEYSYIATRSIVIKLLSFAAMLMFVKTSNDYLIYAFILCTATAGNYVLNIINIKKYIKYPNAKLEIIHHIKPVFILLASTLATEIYTMLDTIMLEYIHGEVYVGYYSNVVKIVRMVYTVVIAMVTPFYPRISQYIKHGDYTNSNKLLNIGIRLILIIGLPLLIGMIITSGLIIRLLFGIEYLPAVLTLKIMSILILVFSVAYLLGHLVLMAASKESNILNATICGAIINAILNYVLIPRLQQNGAAIASVVAEIVVTSILIIHSRNYFKLKLEFKFWINEVIALLAMAAIVIIIIKFVNGLVSAFVLSVILGAIVYFTVLVFLKNELLLYALTKLRKW